MSLYDDIEEKSDQVAGWSQGIRLLQSQLQLKKATVTQTKREQVRKSGAVLAPVIDLKSRKEEEDGSPSVTSGAVMFSETKGNVNAPFSGSDPDCNVQNEYDPMWPNDYEKVVKDMKNKRDREKEKEEDERRRRYKEERDRRTRERYEKDDHRSSRPSGFGGRKGSDEEEEEGERPRRSAGGTGAAIAPPPSLQEAPPAEPKPPNFTGESYGVSGMGGSVAAKIMAKYGFKEGQGLGKQEQGIASALQVEKTSKRGGRIISENDTIMPPPAGTLSPAAAPGTTLPSSVATSKEPQSITEMMKNPSKVVLLRNMVGPGEVDEELEPEVKEECNGKYGDVTKVLIFEIPHAPSDEAVRIFVEFKRIESAIKAVVDLNGRYFGGRQVKAGFYDWEKLQNLELLD